MRDVVCDTSPLQYLHQLGCLELLPALAARVLIPEAVVVELAVGRRKGFGVPDPATLPWAEVVTRVTTAGVPDVKDLGAGEREALAIGLQLPGVTLIIDDRIARQVAEVLRLPRTGTVGLLLSAKQAGLVAAVRPQIERLVALGFRLSPRALQAALVAA
ncbi:MAG: DUF3368 domain-containing protein, partial [Armatimonadetes bacterium]|nr:DUF3368 domain-containing protein [Armatimonadota bacterium]